MPAPGAVQDRTTRCDRSARLAAASVFLILLSVACRQGASSAPPLAQEIARIRPEAIRAHLAFLADDALEGRKTGTRGYDLAAKYIRSQLVAFGAEGGVGPGEYLQTVSFVHTRVAEDRTQFEIHHENVTRRLTYGTDYLLLDTHRDLEGGGSGRVVFVGYGVSAPEFGIDDYAGLDVNGAIVSMLQFESPSSLALAVRAYYSSHDTKIANAARHGALGGLYLRSREEETRFSWSMLRNEVQNGFNSLRWLEAAGRPAGIEDRLRVVGALNQSGAEALFKGKREEASAVLIAASQGRVPKIALTKTVSLRFAADHEDVTSANVVAAFPDSDPALRNEYVVDSAHADHLGIGPALDGDSIYNGAMDNAGGCAVLLEVARAFGALPQRPKRTTLFVFVTGEEAGLLGSDYFAHHPTVRHGQIVANLNIDGGTSLTPVDDVIAWGAEHSTLGASVDAAARQTGFSVSADPFPEEGIFARSDQFLFRQTGCALSDDRSRRAQHHARGRRARRLQEMARYHLSLSQRRCLSAHSI